MLVIVLSVGRVPVSAVHVVDVVAVLDRQVAAVLAVHVPVLDVVVGARRGPRARTGANGARSRCRDRSHTPSGQAAAKPASESSTIVGPGATLAENDAYAASSRPPTDAPMPSSIAATSVVRNDRVSCCEVATGTTISAETSSRPTVRIATVTDTAARTAMARL